MDYKDFTFESACAFVSTLPFDAVETVRRINYECITRFKKQCFTVWYETFPPEFRRKMKHDRSLFTEYSMFDRKNHMYIASYYFTPMSFSQTPLVRAFTNFMRDESTIAELEGQLAVLAYINELVEIDEPQQKGKCFIDAWLDACSVYDTHTGIPEITKFIANCINSGFAPASLQKHIVDMFSGKEGMFENFQGAYKFGTPGEVIDGPADRKTSKDTPYEHWAYSLHRERVRPVHQDGKGSFLEARRMAME